MGSFVSTWRGAPHGIEGVPEPLTFDMGGIFVASVDIGSTPARLEHESGFDVGIPIEGGIFCTSPPTKIEKHPH